MHVRIRTSYACQNYKRFNFFFHVGKHCTHSFTNVFFISVNKTSFYSESSFITYNNRGVIFFNSETSSYKLDPG